MRTQQDRIIRWLCLLSGLAAVICLAGAVSGWCDILNSFAPFLALSGAAILFRTRRTGLGMPVRLLAIFGLAVPLGLVMPDIIAAAGEALAPKPGAGSLKIVTFNIWDENDAPRRAVDLILKQDADIVALQEDQDAFAREEARLKQAYPYAVHCTQKESSGCSLWSKRPFLASGELVPAPYGMALAWGRVLAPDGKPVTVVTVHLAWPFPPRIKWLQMGRLAGYVKRFAPEETIIVGDFNQTPWSFGLRALDKAVQPLTRYSHAMFSWPAYLEFVNLHMPFGLLPIDHVYAGPGFTQVAVKRLPGSSSDHYGLAASFAPRP